MPTFSTLKGAGAEPGPGNRSASQAVLDRVTVQHARSPAKCRGSQIEKAKSSC